MSTTFDDRKSAFEAKYANDQQLQFRVEARTAKMFGVWVAAQMVLNEVDAKEYASSMVTSNLEESGSDDMVRKAQADLTAKGVTVSVADLKARIESCHTEARDSVMNETV
jgi:hypothetical protein